MALDLGTGWLLATSVGNTLVTSSPQTEAGFPESSSFSKIYIHKLEDQVLNMFSLLQLSFTHDIILPGQFMLFTRKSEYYFAAPWSSRRSSLSFHATYLGRDIGLRGFIEA